LLIFFNENILSARKYELDEVRPYLERCGELGRNFSDRTAFIADGEAYMKGSTITVAGEAYVVGDFLGMGSYAAVWSGFSKAGEKIVLKIFTNGFNERFIENLGFSLEASRLVGNRVQKTLALDLQKHMSVCTFHEGIHLHKDIERALYMERGLLALPFISEGLNIWEEDLEEGEVFQRDLRPDNIFLNVDALDGDEPISPDFVFGDPDLIIRRSDYQLCTDLPWGTPTHISPEAARCERGPYSDLYSLGTSCFSMVVGSGSFKGDARVFTLPVQLQKGLVQGHTMYPSGRIIPKSFATRLDMIRRRARGSTEIEIMLGAITYAASFGEQFVYLLDHVGEGYLTAFKEVSLTLQSATATSFNVITALIGSSPDERLKNARNLLPSDEQMSEIIQMYHWARATRRMVMG
jgi:serine/threonine protein kinase